MLLTITGFRRPLAIFCIRLMEQVAVGVAAAETTMPEVCTIVTCKSLNLDDAAQMRKLMGHL